ncbi:uncharacterized protein LOC131676097 [Topomyia yanbarensis]|uniref:uncharacterized protein LOC131676097 n=1 Tax=Topomyia yanbarensis TaxID=2498891 RepID=UPI00273A8ACF|nr:uncharacterized protein LOC131676097 [Topomyia yanbarensis]
MAPQKREESHDSCTQYLLDLVCFEAYRNDPYHAYCKTCLTKIGIARGGKSNLGTHIATKRHRDAASKAEEGFESESKIDDSSLQDNVNEAELKICAWALENNVPFTAVDKLTDLLRELTIDSKLLQKLKLGRTKTASVVESVIAATQHDELVEQMRSDIFSIIVDEFTDFSSNKTLAIVVRVMDKVSFCAKDRFYTAIEIECADHATLHSVIVSEFERDNINYKKNLRGFASDGASVMMGRNNSVIRLFKKECPNMISIKCTCHSLALCASYACEKVPSYVEQLMRDIYNYLSSSIKRSKEFKKMQDIVDLKPLKILHPSATRWLSLEAVINRNLERFDELKLFFSFQVKYDHNPTANRILTHLNDPMTKPIMLFLNYILPLINNANQTFQSENSQFFEIYNETKTLLALILGNLCKKNYVQRFTGDDVDVTDFELFLKNPKTFTSALTPRKQRKLWEMLFN